MIMQAYIGEIPYKSQTEVALCPLLFSSLQPCQYHATPCMPAHTYVEVDNVHSPSSS